MGCSNAKPEQEAVQPGAREKIMSAAFNVLKSQGANTVAGVTGFLKARNLLDDNTERIAKAALSGVSDPKNINYGEFSDVVGKVAKEKGIDMEHLSQKALDSMFGEGSSSSNPTVTPPAGKTSTKTTEESYNDDEEPDDTDDHDSTDDISEHSDNSAKEKEK